MDATQHERIFAHKKRHNNVSAGRYDTLLSVGTNLLTQKQDEAAIKL